MCIYLYKYKYKHVHTYFRCWYDLLNWEIQIWKNENIFLFLAKHASINGDIVCGNVSIVVDLMGDMNDCWINADGDGGGGGAWWQPCPK